MIMMILMLIVVIKLFAKLLSLEQDLTQILEFKQQIYKLKTNVFIN
jgi:hypothetical protein